MELDADGVVVEVALEVEDVALDAHAVAARDGRAHSDVRDRHVLRAVIEEHLRGVDAVARDEHALGEAHIDGRSAELAAELEAVMHGVHEAVRVAEQPVGLLHVAIGDQLAYARRAHDVAVELDGVHNVAADAVFGAPARDLERLALAAVAAAEVVADHDVDGVQLVYERAHEVLPRHLHDRAVEVDENDAVNPENAADYLRAALGRVDEGHLDALDERVRVRVEGEHGGRDAAESIKLITRKGSERIIRYAFDYAVKNGRKKVTAVHKANIMKCTDGLFLEVARGVVSEYPQIEFEDKIVDATCMQLVQKPEAFDVMVLPNLYGDIVSDLCAGLVGGLGLAPSTNIGKDCAIFEAVHGSAPKHAGLNDANPTALILSAVMLLRHTGETEAADRIEKAVLELIKEGRETTRDLGGELGTDEFADAIIRKMSCMA